MVDVEIRRLRPGDERRAAELAEVFKDVEIYAESAPEKVRPLL